MSAPDSIKTCSRCEVALPTTAFNRRAASPDGLQPACRTCTKARDKKDYITNATYRETKISRAKAWPKNNREKYNASRKDLQKRKMEDPVFRLARIVRCRLAHVLRGQKTGKSLDYLGCSFEHLKAHLEAQFLPGMTWENYGKVWHVDHEIPLVSVDPSDDAAVRRLSHYTNLRPLWASVNMSLGGKLSKSRRFFDPSCSQSSI